MGMDEATGIHRLGWVPRAVVKAVALAGRVGVDPRDSRDAALQRRLVVLLSVGILPLTVLWSAIYFAAGARLPAAVPAIYSVVTPINTLLFGWTRGLKGGATKTPKKPITTVKKAGIICPLDTGSAFCHAQAAALARFLSTRCVGEILVDALLVRVGKMGFSRHPLAAFSEPDRTSARLRIASPTKSIKSDAARRKDWPSVRKEALVSVRRGARSARDPTAPSALTDPGLVLVRGSDRPGPR